MGQVSLDGDGKSCSLSADRSLPASVPCPVSPARRRAPFLQSTPELIIQHWQLSYSLEDSQEDDGHDSNIVIDEPCLAWLWEIQDFPSPTGNFTVCHPLAWL